MPCPPRASSPGRRGFALVGLVLLVEASACSVPSPFGCIDDGQCRLDGAAGVCASDHCAYPDPACVSGWSYPVGAGAGLGGQCADPGLPTGTSATTVQTDGEASSATTLPDPTGTTAATTSSSTTDGAQDTEWTTGATTDPVTTQTTGGSACPDPYPNDGPEGLPAVALDQDCGATLMGEIDDAPPAEDWFSLSVPAHCASTFGVTIAASLDIEGTVCLFSDCPSGIGGVTCGRGVDKVLEDEMEGCCAPAPGVTAIYGISCDVGAQFWVRVSFPDGDESLACSPYDVEVRGD